MTHSKSMVLKMARMVTLEKAAVVILEWQKLKNVTEQRTLDTTTLRRSSDLSSVWVRAQSFSFRTTMVLLDGLKHTLFNIKMVLVSSSITSMVSGGSKTNHN